MNTASRSVGGTTQLLNISRQRFVLKRVTCTGRTCTTDAAGKKKCPA